MNRELNLANQAKARRPLIETLEQRKLCSTTVVAVGTAHATPPVELAPAIHALSANLMVRGSGAFDAAMATANDDQPVSVMTGSRTANAQSQMFGAGNGFGQSIQMKAPPFGQEAGSTVVPAEYGSVAANNSTFVGQVLALLRGISASNDSTAANSSDAQSSATASSTNAASLTEMAVAASATTPASNVSTIGAMASAATLANAASIQAEPVVVANVQVMSAAAAVQAMPMVNIPQTASILSKSDASVVSAPLTIATAIVQTATGGFVPAVQAVAPLAQAVENEAVATVAYNFVRFDPTAFLNGAVADFTREFANLSPSFAAHSISSDTRWVWAITGAVIAADVVLVAHWQVRRSRAMRECASASPPFSASYVSEYVRA